MRLRTLVTVLLASALLFASTREASATLVLEYDLEGLTHASDAIVHGQVIGQRSEWLENTIVTHVEIELFETIKGPWDTGEIITIFQLGGVVDDLAMVISGAPQFYTGEEVFLFLEFREGAVEPLVFGLAQGKFTVVADPETGEPMITRDLTGLELLPLDPVDLHDVDRLVVPISPDPAAASVLDARLEHDDFSAPLHVFTDEIRGFISGSP